MGQWDIHQYYFDFFLLALSPYNLLKVASFLHNIWTMRLQGWWVGVAGNQFGSWSSATLSFTLDHLASDHHQEDLPHNQDCPTCRKLRAAKDVGLGDYPTHSSDCELGIADMQSQSVHLSCWLVSMLWRHTVKQILSPFSPLPLPEAPLFSDAGTVTQMAGASLERGRGATWASSLTRWHTHTGGPRGLCWWWWRWRSRPRWRGVRGQEGRICQGECFKALPMGILVLRRVLAWTHYYVTSATRLEQWFMIWTW